MRSRFLVQGLAAMSKRKIGAQLHEAVLTSLTALSRSASSITNRNVDSAVDYVFEQVGQRLHSVASCAPAQSPHLVVRVCPTDVVGSDVFHRPRERLYAADSSV